MNTGALDDEVQPISPHGIPAQQVSPTLQTGDLVGSATTAREIMEDCNWEMRASGGADACDDGSILELFRRAIVQSDQEARRCLEHGLGEIMRDWLHRHPRRDEARQFESEEQYIAQVFERFRRATASHQQPEFTQLALMFRYLQATLNGVLLDTLRAHSRPSASRPLELAIAEGLQGEENTQRRALWDNLQHLFPDACERRVAYLLFQCNLNPKDILSYVPQEFRDVQEICHLRRKILQRILLHSDLMR